MLAELLILILCFILCGTNVYVITVFFVHRHQLTPKTLLQFNLAFCNLLSSYYLSAACLEQVIYGCDTCEDVDQSTGWNMTLCSLSVSSWAFTVVLWYHANQRRREDLRRESTVSVTYGFIAATWLYFTVLTLTHMLGIYGWTFDSQDSDLRSWVVFVLIPFLLPWSLQVCFLLEMVGDWRMMSCRWLQARKVEVESKDELMIVGDQDKSRDSKSRDPMDDLLVFTGNLYVYGLVSVLLSLLLTWFLSTSSPDFIPKIFISSVCVTWINCSISPCVLLSGEQEIDASRKQVDTILRAVSRSLVSYLSLYIPASLTSTKNQQSLSSSHNNISAEEETQPAVSIGVCPVDGDQEEDSQKEIV